MPAHLVARTNRFAMASPAAIARVLNDRHRAGRRATRSDGALRVCGAGTAALTTIRIHGILSIYVDVHRLNMII